MMDVTLRRTLLNTRQSLKDLVRAGAPSPEISAKSWEDITDFAKAQIKAISAELCEDPFHHDHKDLGSVLLPLSEFAKKKPGES